MFEANINLAYKIASKYYKTPYWDKDEAIQIAMEGLWKACLIYEPKYQLSTLAYNIIGRDFIKHDNIMKKQPDVLFNLEDTVVTENLSLNETLHDDTALGVDEIAMDDQSTASLISEIVELLDEIATDLKISKYIVKLCYIYHLEANEQELTVNKLGLNGFVSIKQYKNIISELQMRLQEIM